jgi:glycosyltransferase involved in cell wall biosynthesis
MPEEREREGPSSLEALERRIAELEDALERERAFHRRDREILLAELAALRQELRRVRALGLRRLVARAAARLGLGRLLPEPGPAAPPTPPALDAPAYEVVETGREPYERALAGAGPGSGPRLAMAVSTVDLDAAQGDLRAAIGLGIALERLGHAVAYLPPERWAAPPAGTGVYLSLHPEVDLLALPVGLRRVAWVRDRVEEWLEARSLPLYDGILAASDRAADELRTVVAVPVGVLRDGVDPLLFGAEDEGGRRRGVVAVAHQRSGVERRLLRFLRARPIDFPLAVFGVQRGLAEELVPHAQGPVSFFALGSLYRQAAIVLDDGGGAEAWGILPAEALEALAAGALVISGAALGAREAGLEELPTYVTAGELHEEIRRWLADPAGARALAARLRERVLAEHTWDRRAATLAEFLRSLADRPRLLEGPLLAFFPDYRSGNPYQRLLVSRAAAHGIRAVPVRDPEVLATSPWLGTGPGVVLHVHWTTTVLHGAASEALAVERAHRFLAALDRVRSAGGRLLWTVHNVLPHDCCFPEQEARLCQEIADRADRILVMCPETAEAVRPHYRIPEDRVEVLPHPSYVGVYPNVVGQGEARAELGIPADAVVYCAFGGIRPYKELGRLLDAFERVHELRPEARLVVAGPAEETDEVEDLRARCEATPGVIPVFARIPPDDVQLYLNAADVVVISGRRILNSGAVMLAFSFGRPVVAPRTGCVGPLVTPEVGIVYDPDDPRGLVDALRRAEALRDARFRRAAFAVAEAHDPVATADAYARLVASLASGRGGG